MKIKSLDSVVSIGANNTFIPSCSPGHQLTDSLEALYNNSIIASSLVNQASYADQWVNLGYHSIMPTHTVRVQFDDFTPGVSSNTRYVGFDEMRFVF